MKKALKIFGILFLLLIIASVAVSLIFKDKFAAIIKEEINKSVNAQVDFSDIDISIISGFPKAKLTIEDLSVINLEPFKGDTLFYAKEVALKMPWSGLIKTGEEQIEISSFKVVDALTNIISNEKGITNYDIAKKDPTESAGTDDSTGFSFTVDNYAISNSVINYRDEASKTTMKLSDFNHSGKGDLSEKLVTLETKTSSTISFDKEGSNYLDNNTIELDAAIEIDQEQNKYTFLENTLTLNQLQLVFDGFIKQNEKNNEIDLKFKTPTSDFKNILAALPRQYAKNLENIETKGSCTINGFAKGVMDDTTIPKFNVKIVSENASFKYPDLPKRVENINLNAMLQNATGKEADTHLEVKKLSLQIDEDVFNAHGDIKHLTTDAIVNASLKGTLNLENLSKAYPVDLKDHLKGILNADLNTSFSQSDIENNNYERIKNSGGFDLSYFEFASKDIVNPIYISDATVVFDPHTVKLEKFNAKSGDTDIHATGTIEELFGFLFSDKNLKGSFNVNSTLFKVSDFMVDSTTESENTKKESEEGDALKIPAFLDAKITADVKTVVYDDLTLTNVKGDMIIKDEAVTLRNVTSELFDGTMNINGNIATKNETPTFKLDLGVNNFDIGKSFKGMHLLANLAPIAKALQGKFNTDLKLSGNLDDSFSPDFNSLTGGALAEVLTATISPEEASAFSLLNNQLSFIDLNKLDLKALKTALSFKDGKVAIKPFNVAYDDINVQIAGGHGFDKTLGYTATFDVPAKYFGNEAGKILSTLGDDDLEKVKVPVTASIDGTFLKPQIKTDLKQSVANLTKQLIQIQKDKLLGEGGDVITNTINGILGNDTTKDSTNTKDPITDGVKGFLGGLLGGKKKEKDSIND